LENKSYENSINTFFSIKNTELQRVFGEGIKSGGMYLLGGAPGIGKSTLIIQILQEVVAYNELSI
jgi:DNA repair protein RadA/Sms